MEYVDNARSEGGTDEEERYGEGGGDLYEDAFSQGFAGNGGLGRNSGIFYKTKLCFMFRAGTCPYTDNCKFAHGVEELREPPPNCQQISADHQNPKTRNTKRFRDDQSMSRESEAISLGPTTTNGSFQRPPNWKTRPCYKWETSGHCPFGENCRFAHGAAELQKYGGDLVGLENADLSGVSGNAWNQSGTLPKPQTDIGTGPASNTDYGIGTSTNKRSMQNNLLQVQGQRNLPKWKGPHKISRIYGDWIGEDDE
eukprot:Gb_15421 [translate_table: standard]